MIQPSRTSLLLTNDASLKTGLNSWRRRCKHGKMIPIGELLALPRLAPCAWTRGSPTLGHSLTHTVLYSHAHSYLRKAREVSRDFQKLAEAVGLGAEQLPAREQAERQRYLGESERARRAAEAARNAAAAGPQR